MILEVNSPNHPLLIKVFNFVKILTLVCLCSCHKKTASKMFELKGQALGTYYSVKYFDQEDRSKELNPLLTNLFKEMNKQMSSYQENSLISQFNQAQAMQKFKLPKEFLKVIEKSFEIYFQANHAFDVTIAPIMKVWNFDQAQETELSKIEKEVSQFKMAIGMGNLVLENDTIWKKVDQTQLDVNSLAKGYVVDLIGEILESKKIENFLVNIGGEIVTRGVKPALGFWTIGIEGPGISVGHNLHRVLKIKDLAMATSGSYRKFIELQGKRYQHTIDPRTHKPVTNNIISVSVIARTCMDADAWATALMVLGVEEGLIKAKEMSLEAYFIYGDDNQQYVKMTDGFKKFLI